MIIIQDTREQEGKTLDFSRFPDVTIQIGTLQTGDFSILGFEAMIALERKELNDLIACFMGSNRERFEKELARGAALHRFAVLVEASMEDIKNGKYQSDLRPQSAFQSIFAFTVRYGTTFLFCGDRAGVEYSAYSLLSKYLREIEERYKLATKSGHITS